MHYHNTHLTLKLPNSVSKYIPKLLRYIYIKKDSFDINTAFLAT